MCSVVFESCDIVKIMKKKDRDRELEEKAWNDNICRTAQDCNGVPMLISLPRFLTFKETVSIFS